MTADVDVLVIGGGVVGLAVARAALSRGREVLLIERHDRLGTETTARNSEVIHAGLYYPTDSIRARLCVMGGRMLYRFANEAGVAVRRCGKLLVATSEAEIPRLRAIAANASQNGVSDIEWLDQKAARTLEPEVTCVAACLSPSTGVIDSHGLMQALEGIVTHAGGEIVLKTEALRIARTPDGNFEVETRSAGGADGTVITARGVVVAAGHGATKLASSFPFEGYRPPPTYPARGHYYSLAGRSPFRHLVYPMPQVGGLGVHLTLDVSGRAKFGPDSEWCDAVSYDFDDKNGQRREEFEAQIRRYWPGLPVQALQPGFVGVRPTIYRPEEPAADFAIHGHAHHGVPRLVALFGIESPGLTSSLAIGDCVADLLAAA